MMGILLLLQGLQLFRLALASMEGVRELPLILSGEGWTEPAIELRCVLKLCVEIKDVRRDAQGKLFSCVAQSSARNETETTLKGLVSRLDGACARINQGWWTYEWCHRRQIRQFHVDLPAGLADPMWSLGSYTRSIMKSSEKDIIYEEDHVTTNEEDDRVLSPYDKVVDLNDIYASDGQWCDETLTGRKTQVSFSCCLDGRAAARISSQKKQGGGRVWTPNKSAKTNELAATAFITSIQETAICEYSMEICSPSLCEPGKHKGEEAPAENLTLASYLKPLEGMCLQRHENWWSFEFCFKRHARQFHTEVENVNGKRTMNTVADFSLGYFVNGSMDNLSLVNENQHLPPGFYLPGSEGEPRIELEYINGTPCDLDLPEPRASTVRITCGESNALVSVVEDFSCHYVLTITTPAICKHPVFSKDIPTRKVSCEHVSEQRTSTSSTAVTPQNSCSPDEKSTCHDAAVSQHPADRRHQRN